MACPAENSENEGCGVQCSEGSDACCHPYIPCALPQYRYDVIPLIEGYANNDGLGVQHATGSSTLVKGPKNIVVDTGNPSEKDKLLCALRDARVDPGEVEFVIGTHGHSDHLGNLNVFPNAIFIVSYDISKGDSYDYHPFKNGVPFPIDDGLQVIPTPGHTNTDVSVIVEDTMYGVVAITGDIFEKQEDLDNDDLWLRYSECPDIQRQSREKILRIADYIVPGHGKMFQNTKKVNQR